VHWDHVPDSVNGRRFFDNVLYMTTTLSKICAQHAHKRGGISLAIGRAALLPNPVGLAEGPGGKDDED
jgi:hypothetical protein